MTETITAPSRSAMAKAGAAMVDPMALSRKGTHRVTHSILAAIGRFSATEKFDAADVAQMMGTLPASYPVRSAPVDTVSAGLIRIARMDGSPIQFASMPSRGSRTKFMRTLETKKVSVEPKPAAPAPEPCGAQAQEDAPLVRMIGRLAFELSAMREENRDMAMKLNTVLAELGVKA